MNNVYVRSNKSIKTIMLIRILFLLPLIAYGVYKNGIYLYNNKYCDLLGLFKPLIIIVSSGLIGALINIVFEKIKSKNKKTISECIYSSFHMEYGILLGCIININVNLIIYYSVLVIVFLISKLIKNRINIVALCFIIIYYLSKDFSFLNIYESSKVFNMEVMDYLIGKSSGGIAATHMMLIAICLIGLEITSNTKTIISNISIIVYSTLSIIYCFVTHSSFGNMLFSYNIMFILAFVATDYVTSSYTTKGMYLYGVLLGLITFGLFFVNPVTAPLYATLIVSLFNVFIDKTIGYKKA